MRHRGAASELDERRVAMFVSEDSTWADGFGLLDIFDAEGSESTIKGQEQISKELSNLKLGVTPSADKCGAYVDKFRKLYYKIRLNAAHPLDCMYRDMLRAIGKETGEQHDSRAGKLRAWIANSLDDEKAWMADKDKALLRVIKWATDIPV